MRGTWRYILKIIGTTLALASAICLAVAFWNQMTELVAGWSKSVCKVCRGRHSEFDDYDDEHLFAQE